MHPHQRAGRASQGRRRRPAGVALMGVKAGALGSKPSELLLNMRESYLVRRIANGSVEPYSLPSPVLANSTLKCNS